MMKEKPKDNEEVTRDDCEEEEEEGEEVGKGDNSAAKTPVSLLQVDKSSWHTRDNVYFVVSERLFILLY